ncbi:MAG TPA: efflux RND transporter periplasmic adaptor subunit [Pirellulales bacterium]|nr:efflux RND transporter periplasmic adaptor subunit [Pirellulales bacterium]
MPDRILGNPFDIDMQPLPSPSRVSVAVVAACAVFALVGCQRTPTKTAKTEPAKVPHPVKEDDLNTVELTAEAEERLGIKTAVVERRSVHRRRTYGGEVVLPTGASIVVSAPVGGTLKAVSAASVTEFGTRVTRNEPVFLLLPLLSSERDVLTPAERIAAAQARLQVSQAQVDADGQRQQARTQVDLAEINFSRAERLFNDKAGTAANLDAAKAQLSLAQKALAAAEQRCELLEKIRLDSAAGDAVPIQIVSPRDGCVRLQHATIGEIVPAGAPLFEVVDYDPIWVKTPIYAGELPAIAEAEPARVAGLGDDDPADVRTAEPVTAPPSADPQAATVDLYYQLPNSDGRLRPGQRLNVTLALRDERQSLVLPWSAVVHDIYGDMWVYVATAPHRFVRRRVQVPFVVDNLAVIESGPEEGAQVVSEGVAELYGTQFGASH